MKITNSVKSDCERTELEVRNAMNSVSPDLVFTTETEKDFTNGRLPTLPFQMWSEEIGLRHSFYEKNMRSQILTQKKSSQSEQSKYSILVNELNRRFEVLDDRIPIDEKITIVDHYTQQLVNSGYSGEQIRDIVESSLKGVIRKEENRKNTIRRFKSASETLEKRNFKKLTEATTWYRDIDNESEEKQNALERRKGKESSWNGWRKFNRRRKRNRGEMDIEGKSKIMSVLFVQHTPKSELAKKIREKLESMEKLCSLKFKIVEKTGSKLEELLHKSDSWSDRDCERQDCLVCSSASEEEKRGMCRRRNVVYETYCITCYDNEKRKKDENEIYMFNCENLNEELKRKERIGGKRKRKYDEDEKPKKKKEKREKNKREFKVKYVGETGRSAYERGVEHISDFLNYDESSHLLKHYLSCHQSMRMSDVKFGMRVRNTFRSALERQIGEAVAIDIEKRKGITLMNSKSEYNRCSIPRITTKSAKETLEETEKELKVEKKMKDEIKWMKSRKRNKREKTEEEREIRKEIIVDEKNFDEKKDNEKVEKSERMKSNDNDENEKKRRKLIENREDEKEKNDEKEMEDENEKRGENEKNDENRGENEKIKEIPKIEDFPQEVQKSPKIGLFEKMGKNSGKLKENGTEIVTKKVPPAGRIIEILGLEEVKNREIVKRNMDLEPPPLPRQLGQMRSQAWKTCNLV